MQLGDSRVKDLLRTQWRVLSFGFDRDDLERLHRHHLLHGVAVTLLVGVGRYWDHPDPHLIQRLGLGSLGIAFTLSCLVYVAVLPLRPKAWGFANLLTFITLTAAPALLYAIPVERFMELPRARSVNVAFLAVVAAWRVGLLGTYLKRRAEFPIWLTVVALLLPVVAIIVLLMALNLERAVFDVMSGLHDDSTPADAAYAALSVITFISFISFPVLALAYGAAVVFRWIPRRSDPGPWQRQGIGGLVEKGMSEVSRREGDSEKSGDS